MGKFIVLEGMDGSGKTTVASRLATALQLSGKSVVSVRDPGSSPFSEKLRELNFSTPDISPVTRTLLFQASRIDMLEKMVLPIIDEVDYVILDRFTMSTFVYQHMATVFQYGKSDVSADFLHTLMWHSIPARVRTPDAVVFLDVALETALLRDSEGCDFDKGKSDFMKSVHMAYNHVYINHDRKTATRWARVDSNQPIDSVMSEVMEFVNQL